MRTGLLPRPLLVRVQPPQPHMKYKVGDVVLVESHAGPKVRVRLKKRILKPKNFWGADGWDAQIIYKKDVDALRQSGVPYKKDEKPIVFVFDWQLIKKQRKHAGVTQR